MFGKLVSTIKGWFSKQPTSPIDDLFDRVDVYLPRERLIYQFFDGQVLRAVDPMELYKKVSPKLGIIAADSKAVKIPQSKFAKDAHDRLIALIRELFDIKPLSQGGLTELETLAVFDHWWDFTCTVKKNSSPSQTGAEATSPSTASATEEAKDQGSWNISDSGSTEKTPSTKEPPQSAMEQPLP
jgi:hypothetical protein